MSTHNILPVYCIDWKKNTVHTLFIIKLNKSLKPHSLNWSLTETNQHFGQLHLSLNCSLMWINSHRCGIYDNTVWNDFSFII